MTSLYDILKANRLGMDSDPWIAILGEAWKASEEDYKEYTGLVPYTFIANGQPLLDWYIKGNTVQNGTPTPSNPVDVNGVGERMENLFDKDDNYTVGATTNVYALTGLLPNHSYTCSTNFTYPTKTTASIYFGGGSSSVNGVWNDLPQTKQTDSNGNIVLHIRWKGQTDAPDITEDVADGTIWIMVNEGTIPLPYEPYGIKIPISSANTTTPVYLGEVESTRQIKKLVFDGSESWSLYESGNNRFFYMNIADSITQEPSLPCTHGFTVMSITGSGNYIIRIYDRSSLYPTKDDFTDFLADQYAAGTPVTVWYVLATPTTGIVNEPLMKIGDYADTLTAVQAGIEIPTDSGRNTIDIDTDIKPSEFYMKWKER